MGPFALGFAGTGWDFCLGVFTVILIDIVLAGDNAVVIAMAVKSLPDKERRWGIILGSGFAVLLRVALTVFAAQLLDIRLVKLIGGILLLWIAVKLLLTDTQPDDAHKAGRNLWNAIWIIIVADVTMSTDNVLALAGASKGSSFLLLFGLAVSIPLVIAGSALLAKLMDKYPVIVYAGAAILGKVGGELIMTDPVVVKALHPSVLTQYAVEAVCAVGVILVARLFMDIPVKQGEGDSCMKASGAAVDGCDTDR